MTVRDTNLGTQKERYLEDQTIVNKEFGVKREENHKYIMTNMGSWTNRTVDWYNSERRIIFATTSEAARDKWMRYFKW